MSPDRMTETLTALRTDVDRVGLADSASIRHRGQQRTRNQAIGGTLAALCLVAAGVGVAGGLTGNNSAEAPPAKNGTATTTQQAEQTYALATDPSLQESDVVGIGPYDLLRSPEWSDGQAQSLECLGNSAELGAQQTERMLFYSDLDAGMRQHVLRFDNATTATAVVGELEDRLTGCDEGDPSQETVTDREPTPVDAGEAAFRFSRYVVPQVDAGTYYAEVAVARAGNVVLVLDWSSMGSPYDDPQETWVWTPELIQTALDRAIEGGQP
jgi:hypothetical protein